MDEHDDGAKITRAFQDHRAYLIDLAFRMLGDIGEAEDTVQDAYTRLLAADLDEISDERGWLIVVTSRLCLDRIRSARARRVNAYDSTGIEFVAPADRGGLADPADRVTFDDGVSLALLVVLRRLSPAERVVFVLHDVFQMPFPLVARTVGRTELACRQLAKRARRQIAEGQRGARFDIASAEHRLVTEKFIAACANGDLAGLIEVLAPDAWGELDLGPGIDVPPAARGAAVVAGNLLRFWGPPAILVSHPIAGQPAVLGFFGRELSGVLVFTMRGGAIAAVQAIGDPRKLAILGLQLSERR